MWLGLAGWGVGGLGCRGESGGALAAGLRSGEQPMLAPDRDGSDGALGDIVVDLCLPLARVAGERIPSLAAIGERLRHRRLGRKAAQGIVDHAAERVDLGPCVLLSMRAADIGRLTTHLVFDPVKPGDTCQQVGGERRRARLVVLEDLAPEVGPAGDLLDAVAVVELVVSGITVGLEKAGECGELALRMDAADR